MKTIVSEKGQITIPKPIRDMLGLNQGSVIDFEVSQSTLVGKKVVTTDTFSGWRGKGKLPVGKSVDDYLKAVRGDYSD